MARHQHRDWNGLGDKQRERLGTLGVKKAARARKTVAKAPATSTSGRGAAAFRAGVGALAQYREREGEGGGLPGRGHVERLPDSRQHRTGV
ncbi:hypothetical protein ACIA8F_12790 [Streptomyces sp. NPDC051563]|uniref:hypothetical protein n=1 Tax=Streptomyces sp. NPDC051563 TaxID=3365659 RepID=UPI0037975A20